MLRILRTPLCYAPAAAVAAFFWAAPAWCQSIVSAPAGWTTQTRANGAVTFLPPDLAPGEVYSVTAYDSASLAGKTLEEWLRAFAGPVGHKSEQSAGQLVSPLRIKVSEGRLVSGTGAYAGPNGAMLYVLFIGASGDGGQNIHLTRTLFSSQQLLVRYQSANEAIVSALVRRAKDEAGRRPPRDEVADAKRPAPDKKAAAPRPAAASSGGPLQAANLNGARVFLKFYWVAYPTLIMRTRHLLLFPDGTAFDDLPNGPLPDFNAQTLRAKLHARDVGRWTMAGKNMVLTFPQERVTLTPHPKGWLDSERGVRMNGPNNVYFPVIAAGRARLLGAWKNKSVGVTGTIGGASPMVAGGSEGQWNFYADGRFGGGKTSFFSATTTNVGDAFKSGGDVTASGQSKSRSAGRWRLDGPLLTLEQNGERTVHLAFLLPAWDKNEADSGALWVDGDLWERSDSK